MWFAFRNIVLSEILHFKVFAVVEITSNTAGASDTAQFAFQENRLFEKRQ